MRTLRSVDSVQAALAAALGLSALSCASTNGATVDSAEGGGDTGPLSDTSDPYSPDATSSADATSSPYVTFRSDAMFPVDSATTDTGRPGDGTEESATDSERPDVNNVGCTPVLVGEQDTGYATCNGQLQRRTIVDCPNLIAQAGSQCTSDAGFCQTNQDCTAMPYGACTPMTTGPVSGVCVCSYGCVRDSDCSPGSICVCGDSIGQCETASCNADTCPAGFACAEYDNGCTNAFACQSAADQCESRGDCDSGVCALGVDGGSHCALPSIGCFTGRPFLVAGEPRLPAIASTAAWHTATAAPDVRRMPPALRAELARHWTAVARMEHASIAAFARFALQLLALGAPPELLLDTQRAMADETAHAQLAFTIASAFAGLDVGPGPIAIDAALDETNLRGLIATTFAEGCIGETAAAVEATEAAALARDRTVRATLERIAADETRHAQLAWRSVAWALGQAGEDVRDLVRRCIAQAETEAQDLVRGAPGREDDRLAAYGVLGEAHKRRLRRDVLTEIVLPSARALLDESRGRSRVASQRPRAAPRRA